MDVKRTLERLQKTLPGPTIPAVGSALIGFSAVLLIEKLYGASLTCQDFGLLVCQFYVFCLAPILLAVYLIVGSRLLKYFGIENTWAIPILSAIATGSLGLLINRYLPHVNQIIEATALVISYLGIFILTEWLLNAKRINQWVSLILIAGVIAFGVMLAAM